MIKQLTNMKLDFIKDINEKYNYPTKEYKRTENFCSRVLGTTLCFDKKYISLICRRLHSMKRLGI